MSTLYAHCTVHTIQRERESVTIDCVADKMRFSVTVTFLQCLFWADLFSFLCYIGVTPKKILRNEVEQTAKCPYFLWVQQIVNVTSRVGSREKSIALFCAAASAADRWQHTKGSVLWFSETNLCW